MKFLFLTFLRSFAQSKATGLGLTGWVTNTADGKVSFTLYLSLSGRFSFAPLYSSFSFTSSFSTHLSVLSLYHLMMGILGVELT